MIATSKRYSQIKGGSISKSILYTALMIAVSMLFMFALNRAIGKHIDNEQVMLCNSAKVSGNEYIHNCN